MQTKARVNFQYSIAYYYSSCASSQYYYDVVFFLDSRTFILEFHKGTPAYNLQLLTLRTSFNMPSPQWRNEVKMH